MLFIVDKDSLEHAEGKLLKSLLFYCGDRCKVQSGVNFCVVKKIDPTMTSPIYLCIVVCIPIIYTI